jgi:hypothetical protein
MEATVTTAVGVMAAEQAVAAESDAAGGARGEHEAARKEHEAVRGVHEAARGGGAAGAESGGLGLLEALVREPDAFLETANRADGVALVRALVASVVGGAAVFGAVVGAFRGGAQVAYCAAKVPLVLLGTLVVCTPAFVAIARATGTRMGARDVVALTLGACARFALVLACLAPVVWLLEGWCGYHLMALLSFAACAVAGAAAAALLFRGLRRRPGAGYVTGLAFVAVFGLVGAQTSWLLRPYVVRPQTSHVPFVRQLEGDLPESIWKTLRSAFGIYDEHDDFGPGARRDFGSGERNGFDPGARRDAGPNERDAAGEREAE